MPDRRRGQQTRGDRRPASGPGRGGGPGGYRAGRHPHPLPLRWREAAHPHPHRPGGPQPRHPRPDWHPLPEHRHRRRHRRGRRGGQAPDLADHHPHRARHGPAPEPGGGPWDPDQGPARPGRWPGARSAATADRRPHDGLRLRRPGHAGHQRSELPAGPEQGRGPGPGAGPGLHPLRRLRRGLSRQPAAPAALLARPGP